MIAVEADVSGLINTAKLLREAGNQTPTAIRRAVNRTGDRARTMVVRVLAKQVGTKQAAVKRVLVTKRATVNGSANYRLTARGAHISLKEFGARQTKRGVSAAPWGKRRVFPRTFVIASLGGHVFTREGGKRVMVRGRYAGKLRQPLHKLYGPSIPNEMVKAETAAAFQMLVRTQLPPEIARQIAAILSGYAPRG
jgi:hypothetical protein